MKSTLVAILLAVSALAADAPKKLSDDDAELVKTGLELLRAASEAVVNAQAEQMVEQRAWAITVQRMLAKYDCPDCQINVKDMTLVPPAKPEPVAKTEGKTEEGK